MKKYLLGIDNGGTFCKVALFDAKGKQITSAQCHISSKAYEDGRVERDLNEMREHTYRAIRTVLSISGIPAEEIAAVGLSGHGKGLYVLDREHKVFTSGILSMDSRAGEQHTEFERSGIAEYVEKKHYQKILTCQPICILRWLKDNDRDVYDRIGVVFSAKDYVRYCLTGEIQAEITDLSGTNLLDLDMRSYDLELLKMCGIEEMADCLPPIIGSFDVAGCITSEVAERTGLCEGTPVCGGMFDIDACGLACGMVDSSIVTMIAGTWAINEYIVHEPVTGNDAPMNSLYCLDGYYLVEECSATSSANLQWWLDRIGDQLTYQQVNQLVETVPSFSDVFFVPYVTGSSLGDRGNGVLVGLTAHQGKEHVLRAIYEGVAFNAKWQLERLLKHRDRPDFIRLAGGMTKSAQWVQIFADILQFPIEIPADSDRELGCFGAAIAAGTVCGMFDSPRTFADGMKMCRIEPNPAECEIYASKYAKYCKLLETMIPFWEYDVNVAGDPVKE